MYIFQTNIHINILVYKQNDHSLHHFFRNKYGRIDSQEEAKPRIIEIEETFAENSINQEDIAPVHGKRRIGKCGQVRRASLRVTDEITLGWAL